MKSMKIVACALTLALSGAVVAGCSSAPAESSASSSASSSAATEQVEVKELEMSYITPADVEAGLGSEDMVILDVRKVADYEAGHIPGAYSADMDAAKAGDNESGLSNMKAALQEATGTDNGDGKTLVLVCYSGKTYAQAATNILGALDADMENVKTLEGGMKAWTGEIEQ